MTEQEAYEWIRSRFADDLPSQRELNEAFTAIFGRPPKTAEIDALWSRLRSATPGHCVCLTPAEHANNVRCARFAISEKCGSRLERMATAVAFNRLPDYIQSSLVANPNAEQWTFDVGKPTVLNLIVIREKQRKARRKSA